MRWAIFLIPWVVIGSLAGQSAFADEPALPKCTKANTAFTHLPVDLAQVAGLVPLGNVNPPGHTLPTRHSYVYPKMTVPGDPSTAKTVKVSAMVAGQIIAVERHMEDGITDWSLHIKPCRDLAIYHLHILKLAPAITAAVGDMDEGSVTLGPGFQVKRLNLPVVGGAFLGAAKVFDIGITDFRKPAHGFANPARYAIDMDVLATLLPDFPAEPASAKLIEDIVPKALHNRCYIDYFSGANRAALLARLSNYDGTIAASGTPKCWTHMPDVPGSAAGNWFRDETAAMDALFDEDSAISLTRWNVDPSVYLFSVNSALASLTPAMFTPDLSDVDTALSFPVRDGPDRINRRFNEILDGDVYCYESVHVHGPGGPALDGVLLLKLQSGPLGRRSTLKIEATGASRCAALKLPWSLSPAASTYYR